MTTPTTYLITGGNRGIGRGFVQTFLQRTATIVIAAVRDPSSASAKSLQDLPKGAGSRLITVKLDSSISTDATEAVAQLQTEHGLSSIDLVIANAGISVGGASVRQTTAENIAEHFIVNTTGPVSLFQATADLLQAS
jgi:norsolorinic acid ketoreductase